VVGEIGRTRPCPRSEAGRCVFTLGWDATAIGRRRLSMHDAGHEERLVGLSDRPQTMRPCVSKRLLWRTMSRKRGSLVARTHLGIGIFSPLT
jgi:hypothetical protein